ncbi:MAG: amylo-alpha-1,6-glucosidase, partial [Candidatus Marinimicrobia bacterium]|nr:amylo-alpha-1,6-glucosidase [Candidatus Neomarinimicrobiota bacterium]
MGTVALDDDPADEPIAVAFESLAQAHRDWLTSCTQVSTDNEFFNAMLARSLSDIRVLAVAEESGDFIAAGTPWFSSLFGRDSLITSFQMLAFNPEIARDSLRVLARLQGSKVDDWRDEEPGKILHERRVGEMAALGEIPMSPYYGSVDATPLFLMLAAEYVSWTGDLELVRGLESSLMMALDWIENRVGWGGDRYLSYAKRSTKGLQNQGWKDSRDGVVNGDGTLARAPIAMAEVQGYVYAAYLGLARLQASLGKGELARELRRKAAALKEAFNVDFWVQQEGYFAMALGADGEQATAISSNPGQCLWTGIVDG